VIRRLQLAPALNEAQVKAGWQSGHGDHSLDRFLKEGRIPHIWCPGCGIGIAFTAFVKALEKGGFDPDKTVVVSGIGGSGRAAGYLNLDTYHTTHGRPIPFATGLKLARPEIKVVVFSCDGDLFAIGGNHIIHAARRNVDITVICINNSNYGVTGGQGIVLAGMILGKAVTLFEGQNAVMTQSYGPEARGGACSADVIVSEERINYPRVTTHDILVLMSEEAACTYGPNAGAGALVLVNENLAKTLPKRDSLRVLQVPATRIAEELGRVIVANIVMLGFITAVTGIVSFEAMKRAVVDSIPKGTEELNLNALQAGFDHGRGPACLQAGKRGAGRSPALYLLGARPGEDQAGHRRARLEPHRGGGLFAENA